MAVARLRASLPAFLRPSRRLARGLRSLAPLLSFLRVGSSSRAAAFWSIRLSRRWSASPVGRLLRAFLVACRRFAAAASLRSPPPGRRCASVTSPPPFAASLSLAHLGFARGSPRRFFRLRLHSRLAFSARRVSAFSPPRASAAPAPLRCALFLSPRRVSAFPRLLWSRAPARASAPLRACAASLRLLSSRFSSRRWSPCCSITRTSDRRFRCASFSSRLSSLGRLVPPLRYATLRYAALLLVALRGWLTELLLLFVALRFVFRRALFDGVSCGFLRRRVRPRSFLLRLRPLSLRSRFLPSSRLRRLDAFLRGRRSPSSAFSFVGVLLR